LVSTPESLNLKIGGDFVAYESNLAKKKRIDIRIRRIIEGGMKKRDPFEPCWCTS
jgi:hypothetical protein